MRLIVRHVLQLLLALCPTYRGGIRVAQSSFCQSLTNRDELVVARMWGGMKIQVNPNDYDGRSLFYWGANDRKISWLCTKLLRPGDTLLDIGANYGSIGLLAARRVGPQGRVHCFEPQPRLAECIRVSTALNGLNNLTVHELALSDRNGTLPLTVPSGHTGRASLCPGACEGTAFSVPVCHTGDYLESLGPTNTRVIKLDVESHETAVLTAASGFLEETKPLVLIFESHDDGKPLLNREPVKLLRAVGYHMFQIRQRPLFRVQLRAIQTPADVETGYDFVACDNSRIGTELTRVCSVV
jgi:FkbM family methyltransferase